MKSLLPLDSLAATHRKVRATKPLTAPACGRLIADAPLPGTVVKAKRGNRFKHASTTQAGKAGIAATRQTEGRGCSEGAA